jgi:protein-tyrosine-phosphatase
MAEGFANHYGQDILKASSAGLAPTPGVAPHTVLVMEEMNVDVSRHLPRRYDPFEAMEYDIVVNMAGFKLPGPVPKQLIEWQVQDPYGASIDTYRAARNDLEQRVMRLILDLRRQAKQPK